MIGARYCRGCPSGRRGGPGRPPDDVLIRELQASDLFVLPSLQEGLGLVVLEAMSCELPVIGTPSGGPEAHVRAGQTGFVTRGFSASALADAVIQALEDLAGLRAMGKRAREIIVAESGREVVGARLRATLERVYRAEPS